jgi:hypothetical protein
MNVNQSWARLQDGATQFLSTSSSTESSARQVILGFTNQTQVALAILGLQKLFIAQRVHVTLGTGFLTSISDLQSSSPVYILAQKYMHEEGNQTLNATWSGAIMVLLQKQMTQTTFESGLKQLPSVMMKPLTLNLAKSFSLDYRYLDHPNTRALINEVASNFMTLMGQNGGKPWAFVVNSLTSGSTNINAEVTYEKINSTLPIDPWNLTIASLGRTSMLGIQTINMDKSTFGAMPSLSDQVSENKSTDKKLLLSVTLPAFGGILIFILLILCCTSAAGKSKPAKPGA